MPHPTSATVPSEPSSGASALRSRSGAGRPVIPPAPVLDLSQWPSALSWKTFSGKSVYFLVTRAALLVALSVYAAFHGSTTLLVLALAAFVVDLAHILLSAYIQIRGVALQRWIKRLVVGDLDFRAEVSGADEIAMYGRVLEVLRQTMVRSRALEAAERALAEDLSRKNETLQATLDQLEATQAQIVSQQKLAELGALSAGVAHEIRNPLQFIKNFAETSAVLGEELADLLADPDRLASEKVRADIAEVTSDLAGNMARIMAHSERANRIVAGMLTLGRDVEHELRPVDINRLVVEQTMLAFHAARAEHPDFNLEIARDLDPDAGELHVAPADLGRVFINIVSNACQAVEQKRAAGVAFDPVLRLTTRRNADGVSVAFRDNGAGMSETILDRMFTPFFTTKKGTGGTGLGMSLSYDIVRVHGGTITAASVEGEYAEVTVRLPHRTT